MKEQQKRIGRAEFGNTDFTFEMDGRTVSVTTPELADVPEQAPSKTVAPPSRDTRVGSRRLHRADPLTELEVRTLIVDGESPSVEFKSTLRWSTRTNEDAEWLQKDVTRTIAAFLNGDGGRILLGVTDGREITGLGRDMKVLENLGQGGRDGFLQALANVIQQHLGGGATALIRTEIINLDEHDICIINVGSSPEPVYLHDKKDEEFFIRNQTTTRALSLAETAKYVRSHWS